MVLAKAPGIAGKLLLSPLLMATLRFVPVISIVELPMKAASPAVACRLVNFRVTSRRSVMRASPKFAFPRLIPVCVAVPPLSPAKALMLSPPMLSRSASTVVLLESVTVSRAERTAKLPFTVKKSATAILIVPEACTSAPRLLLRLRVVDPVGVLSVSGVLL